jgi:hypothetical protein
MIPELAVSSPLYSHSRGTNTKNQLQSGIGRLWAIFRDGQLVGLSCRYTVEADSNALLRVSPCLPGMR